jgi:hypothetical protein
MLPLLLTLRLRHHNRCIRCGKGRLAAIVLLAVTCFSLDSWQKYINWVCVFRGTFGWCWQWSGMAMG